MAESAGLFLADGEGIADVSPWEFTTDSSEAGNDIILSNTNPNNGTYAYRASYGGTNDGNYLSKTLGSNYTDIYVRCYVYISAAAQLTTTWSSSNFLWLADGSIASYQFKLGIYSNASQTYGAGGYDVYRWIYRTGNSTLNQTSATNFSLGAWHLCEFRWKAGAGDGGGTLWIDETEIESNLAGTENNDCNIVAIGNPTGNIPISGVTLDIDDVKVNSSYIGPYSDVGGGIVKQASAINAQRRRNISKRTNSGLIIV